MKKLMMVMVLLFVLILASCGNGPTYNSLQMDYPTAVKEGSTIYGDKNSMEIVTKICSDQSIELGNEVVLVYNFGGEEWSGEENLISFYLVDETNDVAHRFHYEVDKDMWSLVDELPQQIDMHGERLTPTKLSSIGYFHKMDGSWFNTYVTKYQHEIWREFKGISWEEWMVKKDNFEKEMKWHTKLVNDWRWDTDIKWPIGKKKE